jgi:predicted PhzF superfamily epimerase YddE/YHI9
MALPLFHVDAFIDRPFAGNPAVVCLLPAWKEDRWLQAVAGEMNLPMTAFLVKQSDHFDLRWFTPTVEVDLCGHATLAAAHILWQQGHVTGREILYSTKGGSLKAVQSGNDIDLDFPLMPEEAAEPPPGLLPALGVSAKYVGKNPFGYLVELESEVTLKGLTPNFHQLKALPMRGVVVTSTSADTQFDFVSRFFAPAIGVDEDQVTGSAHCCLADFWRKRLGKTEFIAFQASARGGVVKVRVVKNRVLLGGSALIVARGELLSEGDEP